MVCSTEASGELQLEKQMLSGLLDGYSEHSLSDQINRRVPQVGPVWQLKLQPIEGETESIAFRVVLCSFFSAEIRFSSDVTDVSSIYANLFRSSDRRFPR